MDYRSSDVGGVISDLLVAPHQFAVAGTDSDACAAGKTDDRMDPLNVSGNAGGISRLVAELLCRPDGLARHLLQSNDGGAFAARGDNQVVAVDERGLAYEPSGVLAMKIFEDIAAPDDRAVSDF